MKEIKRISITDAVVDSIKESIESGEYKVAEKLPTEAKLCESLKVSRTCLREAIRVLQALNYVSLVPGKGAFVSNTVPTLNNNADNWYDVENAKFHDFMEVRMAIETLAVKLSVERASKKNIQELHEIHESFVNANEEQDLVQLIMLDELFHTKIISFTNNQLLININKELIKSFRVYRGNSFMSNNAYINAMIPHYNIIQCFESGNASGAVKEMISHLDITVKDMEDLLKKSKSQNK